MNYRTLGKTGLKVSELSYGCGSVGGLLVRGDRKTMVQTVSRAIELGITYFDTAPKYGDGKSETNLGAILQELGADVLIGTKVMLEPSDFDNIESAVVSSVHASLKRLNMEYVDLIQLHNPITLNRPSDNYWVGIDDVEPAIRAFQSLQEQGKVRFWGITGLGETDALHRTIGAQSLHTIQTCYNLLNPTAGRQATRDFPFQDYRQLIDTASDKQMGTIAIRILAAGALSGTVDRHPTALKSVAPISSGRDYDEDVERTTIFQFLIDEGYTHNLVEAAIRFVISKPELSTALIGISSPEQLEMAVEYADKGPLPDDVLKRLHEVSHH